MTNTKNTDARKPQWTKNRIADATCPECGDAVECGEYRARPRGMRPTYYYVWCPECGHTHRTSR